MSSIPPSSSSSTARLVTPPFVVALVSMFLYFVFAGMLIPVIPTFVEDGLGGGEFAVGSTLVAFSVAAIVVRPAITWIGERHGYRSLMVLGSAIAAVAGFALVPVDSVIAILPLRAAMGIGEAALFVGASALVADISPPERRAESASYLSASVFGGVAIGPVLGEFALGVDRFDRAFVAAALCSVAAAVVALGVPADSGRTQALARPPLTWMHRAAVLPGIVLALGIGGWAAFNSFVPTYVDEIGMSGSAGVFALYSVVCLVLRVLVAKVPERIGLGRSVNLALVLLGVGLVVLAAVPEVFGVYASAALVALGVTFFYPSLLAASVNAVDESERVGVISSFTMFFEIGAAAGGLLLGAVGEAAGKRAAFGTGGLLCVAGLVVLNMVLLPALRRGPRPV